VDPAAFPAAVAAAQAEQRAELRRITGNPRRPTFSNTILALERSGRKLDRVCALFEVHASSLKVGAMPELEAELMPRLTAFEDEITQDPELFRRIEAVWAGRGRAGLDPEQERLCWHYHTRFIRAGARLDPDRKQRIQALNQELATCCTRFSQHVLEAETRLGTLIEREADLVGLPDDLRAAAAQAAAEQGRAGGWLIRNTRSAVEPFLACSAHRGLRERVWRAFTGRGADGESGDNRALIPRILGLRHERAQLLGYASHAHWAVELAMAGTPERALALMASVWAPALAQVRGELAELQALADRDGAFPIAAWDYRFYAEQLRQARFALDLQEVQPYLQLDLLREGMFWAADRLYGLTFTRMDLPVPHPDGSVWAVRDRARRAGVRLRGLWYFDPFAREGKQSGAWMSQYRRQERLERPVPAIVSNNANFLRGASGSPGSPGSSAAPVLISWDDAVTLFHEFGHALHGLLSEVRYPSLSGTAVPGDFVEFPSQLNEHWLLTPELLERFARHHLTGAPMPPELARKLAQAATFNQGFQTLEYLGSALLDMRMHLAGAAVTDPDAFERDLRAGLGMPEAVALRHRPAHFSHIFADDEYAGGYYAYLWADALTADTWEAFLEGGGPWSPAVARRYRRYILAVGGTVDPDRAFRRFRGRAVDPAALMRKRGFTPAAAAAGPAVAAAGPGMR
jgi:peptidyl-dipeptidase Dcp